LKTCAAAANRRHSCQHRRVGGEQNIAASEADHAYVCLPTRSAVSFGRHRFTPAVRRGAVEIGKSVDRQVLVIGETFAALWQFDGDSLSFGVGSIKFADGTVWDPRRNGDRGECMDARHAWN
jgi:hypothetical protein